MLGNYYEQNAVSTFSHCFKQAYLPTSDHDILIEQESGDDEARQDHKWYYESSVFIHHQALVFAGISNTGHFGHFEIWKDRLNLIPGILILPSLQTQPSASILLILPCIPEPPEGQQD